MGFRRRVRRRAVALEATGRQVQLPGVTVAGFREGKIRSFRIYFDDLSLIEQIAGA
jgi:ketosteroid isomerase-like protein